MVRVIWAKSSLADDLRPSVFDVGDASSGIGHQCLAPLRQVDELCAAVGRIGSTGQISQVDEVVHQLRGGSQAQLRPVGQLGEPDAAHPDVAEDLEVRLADIAVSGVGTWRGEVVTKLSQQPDQKLPDRQAVGRRIS